MVFLVFSEFDEEREASRKVVKEMNDEASHRGPDGEGAPLLEILR